MRDRVLVQTSRGMTEYGPVGPRPPIERYIRCSVEIPGGSVEAGLQYETCIDDNERVAIRRLVERARNKAWGSSDPGTRFELLASDMAFDLEQRMAAAWPDRAWFVEIWNETEALSQVYQLYGMPRST